MMMTMITTITMMTVMTVMTMLTMITVMSRTPQARATKLLLVMLDELPVLLELALAHASAGALPLAPYQDVARAMLLPPSLKFASS